MAMLFAAREAKSGHPADDPKLRHTERKSTTEELEKGMRDIFQMVEQQEERDQVSK